MSNRPDPTAGDTTDGDTPPSADEVQTLLTSPGQLFEMETAEIRGIATRTWKHAPASLRVVLELSRAHGSADFIVYEDERLTFEQHYTAVTVLARALVDRFGIAPGDRVAIAMRNLPDWIVAFWAAASVGAVIVPINAWWTGGELAYGLSDSGTRLVFVDTERRDRIALHGDDLPDLEAVVAVSEHFTHQGDRERVEPGAITRTSGDIPVIPMTDLVDLTGLPAEPLELPAVDIHPDDDATIFYTSGTTGRPKGAVGTHRNTCSNLMNLFYVATSGSMRRTADMISTDPGGQNSNLLSVPLFHATGCHAQLVTNTASGGKIVLMHHFDPERALELIERERVTMFGGVPAMVMQILDDPSFPERDTSSVKGVSYGGAPAPPDLVRRINQFFPKASPGNGYGMTETSAVSTMNTGTDYVARPDSVGRAVPTCDVAIVPEDHEGTDPPDLAPDPTRTGELWIKGPNVVRGYWNRPQESASTFTNGWVHTGDIARIDEEGFVYIVDRAKDMIIRGGENVYCVEVEAALFEHPAVADCSVIGVPHPTMGEEVGAVVILRPGSDVDAGELRHFLSERIAAFSVPTRFWFRSEPLPRNPAGKVLKRELRTELLGDVTPI